ncbi:hypothetical protein AQUCO_00900224v1 [Aquilegia coerulea]|uniref:Uncharacterized protein n=1 Tax=Aquilegia coerulea TaxID=218851 RepID=A0A2G5ECJ2_AQUCA|nr:hypothetical protein AQUCO_00900224v1 [Aquilegia coerulea]
MSEIFVQAVIPSSFAGTLGSILRQFLEKLREMEGKGQLQNLTTNLQVFKSLRSFILGIYGLAVNFVILMMAALLATTLSKHYMRLRK